MQLILKRWTGPCPANTRDYAIALFVIAKNRLATFLFILKRRSYLSFLNIEQVLCFSEI